MLDCRLCVVRQPAVRGSLAALLAGSAALLLLAGCGDDSSNGGATPSAGAGGTVTGGTGAGGLPATGGAAAGTGGAMAGTGGAAAGTGGATAGTGGAGTGGTSGGGGTAGVGTGGAGAIGGFAWDERFLRTDGDFIVDGYGNQYQLKGFGIGGWHLLEGYMIGNPGPCPGDRGGNGYCRTDRYIRQWIVEKIGQERADELFRIHIDNFLSENEVAQMASWGFNVLRLPLNANRIMLDDAPNGPPYTYIEEGFRAIDNVVQWATTHGMYLILDMHAAPGAQIGHNIADAIFEGPIDGVPGETICGLDRLWDQPDIFWPRTIDLWLTLAARYADTPTVIGYEFLNEPMVPGVERECEPEGGRSSISPWTLHDNTPLYELYVQLTDALRAAGDRKIHFAEAAFWGMNFKDLDVPWDDNLVYAWHFYPAPTNEGFLQPNFQPVLDQDVPMWLSETGVGNEGEASALVDFMSRANGGNPMAYTTWLHKRSGGGGGHPWSCPRPASYDALLDNWEGTSGPDADTALFEWADSLRTENCSVNTGIVSALGGNP